MGKLSMVMELVSKLHLIFHRIIPKYGPKAATVPKATVLVNYLHNPGKLLHTLD